MRRKGLFGKETRDSDSFISSLEYSFTEGDNLMTKHNQLKNDVAQVEASLKSFKEIRRGDN